MFNLIPAILLLLAGGPFGHPSCDAFARLDSASHKAIAVQLARELEKAGLTAAQAVLVVASCEDKPTSQPKILLANSVLAAVCTTETLQGFSRNARFRDGPSVG